MCAELRGSSRQGTGPAQGTPTVRTRPLHPREPLHSTQSRERSGPHVSCNPVPHPDASSQRTSMPQLSHSDSSCLLLPSPMLVSPSEATPMTCRPAQAVCLDVPSPLLGHRKLLGLLLLRKDKSPAPQVPDPARSQPAPRREPVYEH